MLAAAPCSVRIWDFNHSASVARSRSRQHCMQSACPRTTTSLPTESAAWPCVEQNTVRRCDYGAGSFSFISTSMVVVAPSRSPPKFKNMHLAYYRSCSKSFARAAARQLHGPDPHTGQHAGRCLPPSAPPEPAPRLPHKVGVDVTIMPCKVEPRYREPSGPPEPAPCRKPRLAHCINVTTCHSLQCKMKPDVPSGMTAAQSEVASPGTKRATRASLVP